MLEFVVDANLPYYFSLWNYAKENNLTIITKDADFSVKISMAEEAPPKVIH